MEAKAQKRQVGYKSKLQVTKSPDNVNNLNQTKKRKFNSS